MTKEHEPMMIKLHWINHLNPRTLGKYVLLLDDNKLKIKAEAAVLINNSSVTVKLIVGYATSRIEELSVKPSTSLDAKSNTAKKQEENAVDWEKHLEVENVMALDGLSHKKL